MGTRKSGGYGSNNCSKHYAAHPNKNGPRRNPPVNAGPPFPVQLAYHQQPGQPVLYPVLQPSNVMIHDYAFQTCHPPFPNVRPHIVKAGKQFPNVPPHIVKGESQVPVFDPASQPVENEGNRNFHPPPQGDPNNWHPNASFGSRPYNIREPLNNFNQAWCNRWPFGPRDNINIAQGLGPRTFIRHVPQVIGPVPGFISGPGFPGNITC